MSERLPPMPPRPRGTGERIMDWFDRHEDIYDFLDIAIDYAYSYGGYVLGVSTVMFFIWWGFWVALAMVVTGLVAFLAGVGVGDVSN